MKDSVFKISWRKKNSCLKVFEDNLTNNPKWYKKETETLKLFNAKNVKNKEIKSSKTVEITKNSKKNMKSLTETTDLSKSNVSKS